MVASAQLPEVGLLPRPPGGMGPGLMLALLVHGALVVALAFGVSWHTGEREGVEAELWAAVPQIAAPRAAEPEPVPVVVPPRPAPAPKVEPPPNAQIAIERAKRDEQTRKQKELEREREREKALAQKLEEQRKKEEDAKLAALREKNLKRMMGQAGTTGDASSTGTAARSAGPSAGYAGRIKARIRPNIVFTDNPSGNPVAEIEVSLTADGKIVGQKLLKTSGLPAWDEAVQRAIERTEVLPRDIDGRVPPTMVITFRPYDG